MRLAAEAKRLGIEAWFDTDIESGDRWAEVIEARVHGCDAFAPLVTPGSQASAWCQRELLLADQLGKPLLPLVSEVPTSRCSSSIASTRTSRAIDSPGNDGSRRFGSMITGLPDRRIERRREPPLGQTTDIGMAAERPYTSLQRNPDDESSRADPGSDRVWLDAPIIFLCHVHEDAAFVNQAEPAPPKGGPQRLVRRRRPSGWGRMARRDRASARAG